MNSFENQATFQELSWYFDRLEQERVELGRLSMRNAQVLLLRRQLCRLNEDDFDAVMRAIAGVMSSYVDEKDLKDDDANRKREAQRYQQQELYEKTQVDH